MTKDSFLKELQALLSDLPEEERKEALNYYENYFADAGKEHEEQVLKELGSPEHISQVIHADYAAGTHSFREASPSSPAPKKRPKPLLIGLGIAGGLILLLALAALLAFGVFRKGPAGPGAGSGNRLLQRIESTLFPREDPAEPQTEETMPEPPEPQTEETTPEPPGPQAEETKPEPPAADKPRPEGPKAAEPKEKPEPKDGPAAKKETPDSKDAPGEKKEKPEPKGGPAKQKEKPEAPGAAADNAAPAPKGPAAVGEAPKAPKGPGQKGGPGTKETPAAKKEKPGPKEGPGSAA